MRGSEGEEGSRESRTNEGYKQFCRISIPAAQLRGPVLSALMGNTAHNGEKTVQEKSYWLKMNDCGIGRVKTMYAYLIYIIQNLQNGKNAGSYKKTHLPANVP